MNRATFLHYLISSTPIFTMNTEDLSRSPLAAAPAPEAPPAGEFAGFGAIHLNNRSLDSATHFWTRVAGLQLRARHGERAEFGTEQSTLVVVHETARKPFAEGFSGLYHFALHAPDEAAFARMLYRLMALQYPFSPVDHTMSRAIYVQDPDGITVEFTLETPHRLKRIMPDQGFKVEDVDGTIRHVSDQLDVQAVLAMLPDKDITKPVPAGTRIGHVHFYAKDLAQEFAFYEQLGFDRFNLLPQYKYADLGAGGAFRHRVAMNSWHGLHRPSAPADHAGLRHLELVFTAKETLQKVLGSGGKNQPPDTGYWMDDPSGNRLLLRATADKAHAPAR